MVEIIPRKPKKEPVWQKISFYAALAVLVAVVFGYFILVYITKKTSTTLEGLEEAITKVGTQEDKAQETKVFSYNKKINDYSELTAERRSSKNFFDNFEKLCHPQVWFSDFRLDPIKMEVTVSGSASNFQTIGQQLVIFKNAKSIQEVTLTDLSLSEEGGAGFNLHLLLKPEIFEVK